MSSFKKRLTQKIKICGITNLEDLRFINAFNIDYVGFVLHSLSKRYCPLKNLDSLLLSNNIQPCFVFGYDEISYISSIYNKYKHYSPKIQVPFSVAQKLTAVNLLSKKDLIVSYSMKSTLSRQDFISLSEFNMVVLDTPPLNDGIPGGTGATFDWSSLHDIKFSYWLAGGLNSSNIQKAVDTTTAVGFDVASGLEKTYGKKDTLKVQEFISIIRNKF